MMKHFFPLLLVGCLVLNACSGPDDAGEKALEEAFPAEQFLTGHLQDPFSYIGLEAKLNNTAGAQLGDLYHRIYGLMDSMGINRQGTELAIYKNETADELLVEVGVVVTPFTEPLPLPYYQAKVDTGFYTIGQHNGLEEDIPSTLKEMSLWMKEKSLQPLSSPIETYSLVDQQRVINIYWRCRPLLDQNDKEATN